MYFSNSSIFSRFPSDTRHQQVPVRQPTYAENTALPAFCLHALCCGPMLLQCCREGINRYLLPARPTAANKFAYCCGTYFASAAVAVDSSHMTASSSASWCRFSPPSNFVNGHMSTMWFMVCHWPQPQEGDWARPHLCKLA